MVIPRVRPLPAHELEAAQACYRRNGYTGTIRPEDDALVAEADGAIVGVARLAPEGEHLVLRGMFLDEAHRGAGLGTRMLSELVARIGDRPCWLICGPHLQRFYGQAGFARVEAAEAPPHLRQRAAGYHSRHGPMCLLLRPA